MEIVKKYIGLVVGVVVLAIYAIGFTFPIADAQNEAIATYNLVDVHLMIVKVLVVALIVLCVGFYIYKVAKNPSMGVKFGLGLGSLLVLGLIAYNSASSDVNEISVKATASAGEYQMVGGMVILTVILIALGLLALVGFTVKKMIENAAS